MLFSLDLLFDKHANLFQILSYFIIKMTKVESVLGSIIERLVKWKHSSITYNNITSAQQNNIKQLYSYISFWDICREDRYYEHGKANYHTFKLLNGTYYSSCRALNVKSIENDIDWTAQAIDKILREQTSLLNKTNVVFGMLFVQELECDPNFFRMDLQYYIE